MFYLKKYFVLHIFVFSELTGCFSLNYNNEREHVGVILQKNQHHDVFHSFVKRFNIDVLSRNTFGSTTKLNLHLHKKDLLDFSRSLISNEIPYDVITEKVRKFHEEEYKRIHRSVRFKSGDDLNSFKFNEYHSHEEVDDWLETLQKRYPDVVNVVNIGQSFENRPMKLIEIGFTKNENKPSLFIEAGIHAREWIAPASAIYIINELITKHAKTVLQKINFVVLPITNPDGYEYTRKKDRMWRKNRKPINLASNEDRCKYGVDLNRNFGIFWAAENDVSDMDQSKCGDSYRGPKAFSEPETVNLSEYIKRNKHKLKAYISLHSYSALWIYCYNHEINTYPDDIGDQKTLAEAAVKAMEKVNGYQYAIGTAPELINYTVRGDSQDWAKKEMNIKYSYTIELPPYSEKDAGYEGFHLASGKIIETGDEIWAGIRVVALKIIEDSDFKKALE